jgi:hypothetical protein
MKLRRIALVPVLATMFVALVGCGGGKSSTANTAASAASQAAATAGAMASGMAAGAAGAMQNAAGAMGGEAVPNCGAVKAVWVNLKTKVYHEPGDPAYGKTVHGKYLCPSQARAQGFRPAGGAMTTHHHSSSNSQ